MAAQVVDDPSRKYVALALAAMVVAASPALAHKEHEEKPPVAEQSDRTGQPMAMRDGPTAAHAQMGEEMEPVEDRSSMSLAARLLDWLGRLHPVIVHFPIAFFPAALFTAIVGRRKPAFGQAVQFMVIAGGIIAPIAALLGWFDAISAEGSTLLTVHRWLGTAIGLGGLGLALFAWRRPERNRGAGMIAGLAAITAAIIVQGWYGGALVHGVAHLNW